MMKIENLLDGIDACVFDMDGTLIDSLNMWRDIDIRFFAEHDMEVPSSYDKIISHMSFQEMAIYTKETFHFTESVEEIMKTWLEWSKEAYLDKIVSKPGVKEFLYLLKKRNIPLSLATTNKEELYIPCLKRNGLLDYFSYIENVNHLNTKKSEPKIYLTLAEKMKSSPCRTLVFEDILMAIQTAKKASFKVAAVYDPNNENDIQEIKKEADYFISSFRDIGE